MCVCSGGSFPGRGPPDIGLYPDPKAGDGQVGREPHHLCHPAQACLGAAGATAGCAGGGHEPSAQGL